MDRSLTVHLSPRSMARLALLQDHYAKKHQLNLSLSSLVRRGIDRMVMELELTSEDQKAAAHG